MTNLPDDGQQSRWLRRLSLGGLGGTSESPTPSQPRPAARVYDPGGGAKPYATFVVAASNSYAPDAANADYVCDGTADEVEINAALAAIVSPGGRVLLLEGTYTLTAPVAFAAFRTTLQGQGQGTRINGPAGDNAIETVYAGSVVQDMFIVSGSGTGLSMPVAGLVSGVNTNCDIGMIVGDAAGIANATRVIGCSIGGVTTCIEVASGTIVGNTVSGAVTTTNGMVVAGPDVVVVGNTFLGSVTGIRLTSAADFCMVQGNMVRAFGAIGGYGINIEAGATSNMVTNNDLYDSGTLGSLLDNGTTTVTAAGNRL